MGPQLLAGALLLFAAPARADGLKVLGKELSTAAQAAGMKRVVILPFSPADSSSAGYGLILSEKLTTQIVRTGRVRAVERSLLSQLLKERSRGRANKRDLSALTELGRLSAAEGIITGSFVASGREVYVQARLIDVASGDIVAASERRVALSRFERLAAAQAAPPTETAAPILSAKAVPEYCVGYEEVVDRIESGILDLKARYWALQMHRGVSISGLSVFPGEAISDNELRQKLYDRMNEWYARRRVPELSMTELQRLLSMDRSASLLSRGCKKGAEPA